MNAKIITLVSSVEEENSNSKSLKVWKVDSKFECLYVCEFHREGNVCS
jgi:hypothetical protein